MGLLKILMYVVGVAAVVYMWKAKLHPSIGGKCRPDFQKVCDVFRRNIETGRDKGSAFAAYHKGEKVVDIWGGYADIESLIPWREDTITQAFSATKGVAAIIAAKMVEQGHLDYRAPVSRYWPEFAQNDKDNITVEMLLSHQAGLVLLDEPISVHEMKTDPDHVERILARQRTVWPAGTTFGYHALTFGLYVDTLLRKADPQGRDVETIFQEEIAGPFGIDFHTRVNPSMFHRVARLYPKTDLTYLIDALFDWRYITPVVQILLYPDSLMARCMTPLNDIYPNFNRFNDPEMRDVTITSLSGTGTARGLAKLYGILANGGEFEGRQLLSEATIEHLKTAIVSGYDKVMVTGLVVQVGPGTRLQTGPKGSITFGHSGHGGQVGHADVASELGVSYLSNHLSIHGVNDDRRYMDLEQALYDSIAVPSE